MAIVKEFELEIADTETDSEELDLGRYDVVGFRAPASFDGAGITFKTKTIETDSEEDLTFEGTAVSFAIAAGERCGCAAEKFACAKRLIVVSDTAQTGDGAITVLCRELAAS